MFVIPLLLAAGSLPTLISGAPVPSLLSNLVSRITSSPLEERAFQYTLYGGTGTVADGWPAQSQWVPDFTTMFNMNKAVMSASCTQFGVADNSDAEISEISTAIQSVSASTGIDARFILAIMMQESNGCVRAPTTNYGVVNPGLMQSHNGAGSCNDGTVQNPCPQSEVTQMITDGTAGTSSGDGLKQCLAQAGTTDVSMYYKAARIYNSGSIASTKNLGQGIATHCYASDIANRLTGWSSGPSSCTPDAVAALTTTVNSNLASSDNTGSTGADSVSTPPASTTAAAAPVVTSSVVVVPLPATSPASSAPAGAKTPASTPSPSPSSSPAPAAASPSPPSNPAPASASIYPGAVSPCQSYYTVVSGDYCDLVASKTGVSFASLRTLNPGLDAECSNLWLGYRYCIQA
ncbi:carbohydrate-binding module family 50 protein [Hyaloscypha hepaticicola]|uniref:Carbohydrate-binding module family 50 protein n=1 Tax=Hyaloscypha hepaticicola TaxID=2082293 RepID=A0A2J6QPM3_9HELO|nr:carbohydrate-binding module family 50 protein [Hyaloscypha hepaticicola]